MGQAEESPETVSPGSLLAGKYRIESELGRGAMGTVWLATHTTLGQKVAIKIISAEHASSDELRRRFDNEARAAAKLRSRFVVGVHDHGETASGLPYIVMEYLQGECLEDRIARLGALPLGDATTIARHVGRALAKAHSRNIVHRDLKPANIYISAGDDEDGDGWIAKVLDFGIAKMDDFGDRSTTKTGTVLGTPLFMSPEQVRGASNVDSRADLYSLGMVIYNMVTGTYAFEGQSFGDLLVSICTDPLPHITERAPHAPAALDDWFQKACARDREDRFQTADDMIRGLTDALGFAERSRLSVSDLGSSTLKIGSQQQLAETQAIDSSGEYSSGSARARSSSAHATAPSRGVPRTQVLASAAPRTTRSTGTPSAGALSSNDSNPGAAVTVHGLERKRGPLYVGLALGALALVGGLFVAVGGLPNGDGEALAPAPASASQGSVVEPRSVIEPQMVPDPEAASGGSTPKPSADGAGATPAAPNSAASGSTDTKVAPLGQKPTGSRPLSTKPTRPTKEPVKPSSDPKPDPGKPEPSGDPDVGF